MLSHIPSCLPSPSPNSPHSFSMPSTPPILPFPVHVTTFTSIHTTDKVTISHSSYGSLKLKKKKKKKKKEEPKKKARSESNKGIMKFGKRLKSQIEESLPEWRDKYLSYKDLKKLLRGISADSPSPQAEAEFVQRLNSEIEKFNAFFLEQEEEFVIRQKELQERIKSAMDANGPGGARLSDAEYAAEIASIRKDIVNFHGEMVLLLNYSSINYTGLAKILKKYDKRTGYLLRLPFIERVLKQPFFTTELLSKLVKDCESMMEAVFPASAGPAERKEREALMIAEKSIFRNTVAALMTMQELRKGSSTYGHFSLPPLELPDSESDWLQSFKPASPIPIQ